MVSNADQANLDGDSLGNVCDTDDDGDGVADGVDNCPLAANPKQSDGDVDGLGDACDTSDESLAAPGPGSRTLPGPGFRTLLPAPVHVSHTSLTLLWLMTLMIGTMGVRGTFAISRRSI